MPEFVHLHTHTEYSLREGLLRIKDYIQDATLQGHTSIAITDTNALYGAIGFYRQAKEAGLNPIIGVQILVGMTTEDADRTAHNPILDSAVFLAESFTGYQNLCRLVSLAQQRIRTPMVTFNDLAEHQTGVLALIGGGESVILRFLSEGREEEAHRWLTRWEEIWPATHLFIDVQDHGLARERQGLPALVRTARQKGIPLVATNDVHYRLPEEADTQRVLAQLENAHTPRLLEGNRYHLATPEEMVHRFGKLPEAVRQTLVIAERCHLELPLHQTLLPKYPTQTGEDASAVLKRAATAGAMQRYGALTEEVQARLDYELDVICRLGFADYFLVVADFIRFAHKSRISTGPGRGSAAGSLVAFALRITDVDPIANRLLFERFLNPERVSWPDIDTDFEYERRNEVIQYVVNRYGPDYVAQIGTFGTLAARAAVRDAGRALQVDPKLVDRVAKLIPSYPGVTLKGAFDEVAGLREILTDASAKRVWDTAVALEGLPRHTSVHAAGVVISPIPLTDVVPVQTGADGTPVTQYAMEDVESIGLMKMDFLGLRTLTLIDQCVARIQERTGHVIDWRRVPDTDGPTFEMLSRGETDGCFQLESTGVRRVLRELRPSNLEDIIAVISLYRPGPMENIPAFIAAKHKKVEVQYPHPDLEPILKDTYGVIVYQEQIMQIAAVMAGFSLGQADLLRRAVGKKKRDVLDAERERFVDGCMSRGYDEENAHKVYDLIVRFADYGFNRCHAAAYAVLAYRTAYLRANFLPDFLAGLCSMAIGAGDKILEYTRDAKKHGVQVLPPDVNLSDTVYTVESPTTIRTGLLAVKNVGRAAVDAILQSRSTGRFTSLADMLHRVNGRVCNRKAMESLLEAGALSAFIPENVTKEVAVQMLEQAYMEVQEGKQVQGLGLHLDAEQVLYIRYHQSSPTMPAQSILARVKDKIQRTPGSTKVALFDEQKRKLRLLEPRWSVSVTPELISVLEEIVGIGNVRVGNLPAFRHLQ